METVQFDLIYPSQVCIYQPLLLIQVLIPGYNQINSSVTRRRSLRRRLVHARRFLLFWSTFESSLFGVLLFHRYTSNPNPLEFSTTFIPTEFSMAFFLKPSLISQRVLKHVWWSGIKQGSYLSESFESTLVVDYQFSAGNTNSSWVIVFFQILLG